MNTVIREKNGELKAYNTDCAGALTAIEDGLRRSGVKICLCSYLFEVKLLICFHARIEP